MRADRLLSLLMLLQVRGRMTARVLAEELEVSERTIYRDIDALAAAGVPVYGEPGAAGGYALLEDYRSGLTGLAEGEIQALLALGIPEPLAELGLGEPLRRALLKLAAAGRGAEAPQRFLLDASAWRHGEEAVPYLDTLQRAVWGDRRLRLTYTRGPAAALSLEVDPLGLVSKAGEWYLVYAHAGRPRVIRVLELRDVQPLGETFARPEGLDLAAIWQAWRDDIEAGRAMFRVLARVRGDFLGELHHSLSVGAITRLSPAGTPQTDGSVTMELRFESLEAARSRLLGFGRGVEVLDPPELRRGLLDLAEQVRAMYA
jgi:predicted DNA-binding transcriptional regulator YafY